MAEVNAFEPNYRGSPMISGGPQGSPSAISACVCRALGPDLTLIARDRPAAELAAFQTAARAQGVPLAVLADTRAVERCDWGAGLILVHPHGFVGWSGDSLPGPDEAAAIIATLTGR